MIRRNPEEILNDLEKKFKPDGRVTLSGTTECFMMIVLDMEIQKMLNQHHIGILEK